MNSTITGSIDRDDVDGVLVSAPSAPPRPERAEQQAGQHRPAGVASAEQGDRDRVEAEAGVDVLRDADVVPEDLRTPDQPGQRAGNHHHGDVAALDLHARRPRGERVAPTARSRKPSVERVSSHQQPTAASIAMIRLP